MDDKKGVSPVIGVILLTAVTVALVSLAAFFVFDVGNSNSSGAGTATVTAEYGSESSINVQLIREGDAETTIVRSALGTEYMLNKTGDSITLLNQDGNKTPIVLSENNGERTVLRSVPPRSFNPDIVVSNQSGQGQYSTVQSALDSAKDEDIIVLKKDVYYENIDVDTPNITLVGESGTVIADNSSDSSVISVQASGVRVSNIDINANSSQGGAAADYGINTSYETTLVNSRARDANKSSTSGDVTSLTGSQLVSSDALGEESEQLGITTTIPSSPLTDWTEIYSGIGYDRPFEVAVDSGGNVIVAGRQDVGGDFDWRIVKYNESGGQKWVQTFDSGGGEDAPRGVAVDSNNNVIAVGYTDNVSPRSWRVAKYDSQGNRIWSSEYTSKDGESRAYSVTTDSKDNIIVSGLYKNSTDDDWRVVKYNSSGDRQWVRTFDSGNGNDGSYAITVDNNDNVIAVGYRYNGNDYDWRIAKYNSTGDKRWAEIYDSGNGGDFAYDVATDSQQNIVVVGRKIESSDRDWRTAKYNASGSILWKRVYDGGNGNDGPRGVTIDSKDNIAVVGYEYNGKNNDWRTVKYNTTGSRKWVETYDSGNGRDIGRSVAVARDSVIIVGEKENADNYRDWRIEKLTE